MQNLNEVLPTAEIGVFGGSGFYEFLENPQIIQMDTPYGPTSCEITIGTLHGKQVAFLPRHGKNHTIPPHLINYRANVWAFKQLGVKYVISPCAVGSLQERVAPGSFVIVDQYVDRTKARKDTFFDGPNIVHTSSAEPYSKVLRELAIEAARKADVECHPNGTVVVIEGPRFSTRSESHWFRDQGWEVINMSQYPEVHLVKELDMQPCGIALVTDYDAGLPGIEPVTHEEVLRVMAENTDKLKKVLNELVALIANNESRLQNEQAQLVGAH